jgi:hypothetical protein
VSTGAKVPPDTPAYPCLTPVALQIGNIYARNKEGASDSRHALFRRRANQLKKATSEANKET